ncbi:uncharacterized protein LOC134690097 [Mytilus trossulus]|uniref:uncharacterized protein LOC134690097 n=1 Tax=Mytilus trossulus TaxID=6551 RepID=UPI003003E09A
MACSSIVRQNINVRPIKFDWSIKGYHVFRLRPHVEIPLNVELEVNNPYDPHAMKVSVPTLQHIPQHLHDSVTKDGNPPQNICCFSANMAKHMTLGFNDTLCNTFSSPGFFIFSRLFIMFSKQVGRVPANLCKAFHLLTTRGYVENITCRYTGEATVSTRRLSHQQFRRRRGNEIHDQTGGGADLKCHYVIQIKKEYFEHAMHIIEECVTHEDLQQRLLNVTQAVPTTPTI